MHRATPLNTSFRSYVGGGARATIPEVDDKKQMQETQGNFMANEQRKSIEAPQNYGFTSVAHDADKGKDGKITSCAESFVQFMGGNRSFPVMQNMDDRRHRMKELEKGDVGMFRGVGDKLQMHFNGDGGFMTGPRDKTLRMHLLDEDSEKDQQQQQQGGQSSQQMEMFPGVTLAPPPPHIVGEFGQMELFDASGGGGSNSKDGQQKEKKGQKARYKDGQKSYRFQEITKDKTRMGGETTHMVLNDQQTYVHCRSSDYHVYLGAEADKKKFDYVLTVSGPCKNVKGRIGG